MRLLKLHLEALRTIDKPKVTLSKALLEIILLNPETWHYYIPKINKEQLGLFDAIRKNEPSHTKAIFYCFGIEQDIANLAILNYERFCTSKNVKP